MIIVFFHVLFLLGKYVCRKYRGKDEEADELDEKPVSAKPCEIEDHFYDEDTSGDIKFNPPAYIQRYNAVLEVITGPKYKGKIHKVVDFGCSELGFFSHLKHTPGIQELLCVDIDRQTLELNKRKIEAFTADFLHMRDAPLKVFVYEGSITDQEKALENCDAVVCIELIEHLYPETLLNVPSNVFGFIKPQVAIMTTPNADFNVLFPRMKGFRHYDHKFEWSRKEFEDWAHDIVHRYPDYEVTFHGICPGPEGTEHLGCCSQMAVFHRRTEVEVVRSPGVEGLYQLVAVEDYPFRVDNRPDEVKILDEASYFIRKFQMSTDDEEMPLDRLTRIMDNLNITVDSLRDILQHGGYEVVDHEENGPSVICPPLSEYSGLVDDPIDEHLNEDAFLSDYESSDEPGPPPGYYDRWPAIHDQDDWDEEENWDERLAIEVDEVVELDTDLSVNSDFFGEGELPSRSITTAVDGLDFQDLDIPNDSRVSSPCDGESIQISSYPETTVSHQESGLCCSEDVKPNVKDDSIGLRSMCSIYLEASCNENTEMCPQNITDPNFECSTINDDFSTTKDDHAPSDVSFTSEDNDQPQLTSTPQKNKASSTNGKDLGQPETCRHHQSSESQNCRTLDRLVEKNVASSSCESPPNSWSPEIMDSGYPNTCSAPDMTPEYDLPSIAQDSASDSESSSVAKPPRQGFLEHVEVENGDLANNNRDGEGNNMIPAVENDPDDLQPLIDVLENDMENENDIYVVQNGFPAWLLRIQDVEAVVINQPVFVARNAPAGDDEGFDSSSSESEGIDENQNKDEDTDNDDVENLDEN